jgi:hypothetical protein
MITCLAEIIEAIEVAFVIDQSDIPGRSMQVFFNIEKSRNCSEQFYLNTNEEVELLHSIHRMNRLTHNQIHATNFEEQSQIDLNLRHDRTVLEAKHQDASGRQHHLEKLQVANVFRFLKGLS